MKFKTDLTEPPSHHADIAVDDEGKVWRSLETYHCAGGLDEHEYNCRFNHWTEWEWVELEETVSDA